MDIDDLADMPAPTEEQMALVVRLARRQYQLEKDIAQIEEALKVKNAEHRKVASQDLPEAMAAAGINSTELTGGYKISLETTYKAGLSKENPEPGLEWLEQHNAASLIKHHVAVEFGKGEDARANALAEQLKSQYSGNRVLDTRSVHWQTLTAFVREKLQNGISLPFDLLGIHVNTQSVIEPPKEEEL
jgi:hypothetical protein